MYKVASFKAYTAFQMLGLPSGLEPEARGAVHRAVNKFFNPVYIRPRLKTPGVFPAFTR
jgi:hypothetical protein